jgi:hypothetical protein
MRTDLGVDADADDNDDGTDGDDDDMDELRRAQ